VIIVIVHIKGIITIGANNVTFVDKVTIEYLVPLEMTPSLVVQAMILLSALLPVTMPNKP
jgi:hypothetical protein